MRNLPVSLARTLSANRVECKRAGITAITFIFVQPLFIKSLCRASYTLSGISITAMPERPRNSNWALIVTGKHKLVNRTCQKFLFFTRGSYEIHTQHIEKVVLTAV